MKARDIEITEGRKKKLESNPGTSLVEFMNKCYESGYADYGYLIIGDSCGGPMPLAEASARDPLFWRWQKHLTDFVRTTLNTKVLPEG